MGFDEFRISDCSVSVTYECQLGFSERNGRQVKVVDGPGLCDTREKNPVKAAMKLCDDMAKAMSFCVNGFHALILVLQYGQRFTPEDLSVTKKLAAIFGEVIFKDFVIIVFTHGEEFDLDIANKPDLGTSFSDWCHKQTGDLKDLIEKCQNRTILFSNKLKQKRHQQSLDLLSMVDKLPKSGQRYTNALFQEAARMREEMIIREKSPFLNQEIAVKIDALSKELANILTQSSTYKIEEFQKIKEKAEDLEKYVKAEDKETGILNDLLVFVRNLIENITHTIQLAERNALGTHMGIMRQQLNRFYMDLKSKKNNFMSRMAMELSGVKSFISTTFLGLQSSDGEFEAGSEDEANPADTSS